MLSLAERAAARINAGLAEHPVTADPPRALEPAQQTQPAAPLAGGQTRGIHNKAAPPNRTVIGGVALLIVAIGLAGFQLVKVESRLKRLEVKLGAISEQFAEKLDAVQAAQISAQSTNTPERQPQAVLVAPPPPPAPEPVPSLQAGPTITLPPSTHDGRRLLSPLSPNPKVGAADSRRQ